MNIQHIETTLARKIAEQGAKYVTPAQAKKTAGREQEFSRKLAKTPNWFEKKVLVIRLMFALVKDWANGSYRKIPFATIAMIVFAIIYFLNPMDAIPDPIPVLGYVDDASVIALAFSAVEFDLKEYARWKGKYSHIWK